MTDLRELLSEQGIKKAILIDDVFDKSPRSDELDEDSWSNFFDDIGASEHQVLSRLYPKYDTASVDDLKYSSEFIGILWGNRNNLPSAAHLFEEYEKTRNNERRDLDNLIKTLEGMGLACTTMGRDLIEQAKDADLIFVDLFLGYQQSEEDMNRAIQRVKEIVEIREDKPPLIVLMSRSHRIYDKRNEFRDEAGLLGSMFRVVRKAELAEEGKLEKILTRLASHYEDAKRVAEFVHAWDSGLSQARENFIKILRRLDLSDLGQIQALLLDFEGQELGEYLLDVADRTLQHEIEGNNSTISATLELNKIDLDKYPPPHLVGTPDLQELVHRMVFLHPERLRISDNGDKLQFQFGDILRWKDEGEEAFGDKVSLIVSPACDLVRRETERVMLLSGTFENLSPANWSYGTGSTSIVILPEEDRKWIKWNFKNIKSLGWNELERRIGEEKKLKRIGRLREVYAIEIQQMALAKLGRIGRPASLPVPFPVTVSFFYVDREGKARRLDEEEVVAACYVGRGQRPQPVHKLVLTEQTCDQMEKAIGALEDHVVHNSSRASLIALKADRNFFMRFERGDIDMSPEKGTKYEKSDNRIFAAISRGENFEDGTDVKRETRKAALIVNVMDVPGGNPS